MICPCGTHFCFLCSAYLDVRNPYAHFNTQGAGCYQRLWEGEEEPDLEQPARWADGEDFLIVFEEDSDSETEFDAPLEDVPAARPGRGRAARGGRAGGGQAGRGGIPVALRGGIPVALRGGIGGRAGRERAGRNLAGGE